LWFFEPTFREFFSSLRKINQALVFFLAVSFEKALFSERPSPLPVFALWGRRKRCSSKVGGPIVSSFVLSDREAVFMARY
jgi:hypothetical protein